MCWSIELGEYWCACGTTDCSISKMFSAEVRAHWHASQLAVRTSAIEVPMHVTTTFETQPSRLCAPDRFLVLTPEHHLYSVRSGHGIAPARRRSICFGDTFVSGRESSCRYSCDSNYQRRHHYSPLNRTAGDVTSTSNPNPTKGHHLSQAMAFFFCTRNLARAPWFEQAHNSSGNLW